VYKGVRDDKSKTHTKFLVTDKFKRIYILIKESIQIGPVTFNDDDVEFVDE